MCTLMILVCDPVMGDNGRLYIPEELVPVYQELIIPLATIITPNLFETQILTDMEINNLEDVWKAIEILHKKGCETVVISSAELSHTKDLCVFASSLKGMSKLSQCDSSFCILEDILTIVLKSHPKVQPYHNLYYLKTLKMR